MRFITFVLLFICCCPAHATDGQFDPTFGTQGRETFRLSASGINSVVSAASLADGRLLISAECSLQPCIARLKSDGSFDTTFGPNGLGYVRVADFGGVAALAEILDMTLLADGRIAVFAFIGSIPSVIVLLPDGSALDPTVGSGIGRVDNVLGSYNLTSCGCRIVQQPDGKIVVGANSGVNNVGLVMVVARLNANLSGLDASFGTSGVQTIAYGIEGPGVAEDDLLQAIAVQADGKIVVAGYGVLTNNSDELEFARLLPTGARDATFGPNADGRFVYVDASGHSRDVANIALDSAKRMVFGGRVATGVDYKSMVGRLTTSGALDSSFAGTGFYEFRPINTTGNNEVHSLALTADSIFAGSQIPQNSGDTNSYFAVTRLTMSGVPSAAFGSGGTSYSSFSVESISDTDPNLVVTPLGVVIAGSSKVTGSGVIGVGRFQYEHIFGDAFQ